MVTLECAWCGKAFKCWPGKAKKRRYCSRECDCESRKNRVTIKCAQCGKDFSVVASQSSNRKHCNWNCRNAQLKSKIHKHIQNKKPPPRKAKKFVPMPELTASELKRFWGRVDKSPGLGPHGDCWEWTGKTKHMYLGFRYFSLRRISYVLAHGSIPDDMHIFINCDNPRCVNPQHLIVKQYCWDGLKKLTVEEVEEIYRRYLLKDCTYRQLGKEYGVTRGTIYFIINNIRKR